MKYTTVVYAALCLSSAISAQRAEGLDDKAHLQFSRSASSPSEHNDLEKRLTIEERIAILGAGGILMGTGAGIASYVATMIKNQSDKNSCGVISGTVDSISYQYSVKSTGPNCDTTAELKTIQDAVQRGIDFMNTHNINQACFDLTHGGTWKGLLQLAAPGQTIVNYKCLSVTYTLTV